MTELQRRHTEIESVVLTDDEIKKAIWQAKIVKWNRERNKEYWEKLETSKSCPVTTPNIIRNGR